MASPIKISVKGNFRNTERFLKNTENLDVEAILNEYGAMGVDALSAATPYRTGATASSWGYEIESNGNNKKIIWINDNVNKGVCIAVILQYGHGTRQGGYVTGIDYINPALRPIFQGIADDAWKEVTK